MVVSSRRHGVWAAPCGGCCHRGVVSRGGRVWTRRGGGVVVERSGGGGGERGGRWRRGGVVSRGGMGWWWWNGMWWVVGDDLDGVDGHSAAVDA